VAAFITIGIIVLVLIIVGVMLLVGESANEKQAEAIMSMGPLYGEPSISLDDVIKGKFSPKGFNGTWISGETKDTQNGTCDST
jgi:hypothetical protein